VLALDLKGSSSYAHGVTTLMAAGLTADTCPWVNTGADSRGHMDLVTAGLSNRGRPFRRAATDFSSPVTTVARFVRLARCD
jgi:hypothetical protein